MLQIWEGIVYGAISLITVPCKGVFLECMATIQETISEVIMGS